MSQTHYIYMTFSSEKTSCLLKKNYRHTIVLVEEIVLKQIQILNIKGGFLWLRKITKK